MLSEDPISVIVMTASYFCDVETLVWFEVRICNSSFKGEVICIGPSIVLVRHLFFQAPAWVDAVKFSCLFRL